jgi:hypothetical protein
VRRGRRCGAARAVRQRCASAGCRGGTTPRHGASASAGNAADAGPRCLVTTFASPAVLEGQEVSKPVAGPGARRVGGSLFSLLKMNIELAAACGSCGIRRGSMVPRAKMVPEANSKGLRESMGTRRGQAVASLYVGPRRVPMLFRRPGSCRRSGLWELWNSTRLGGRFARGCCPSRIPRDCGKVWEPGDHLRYRDGVTVLAGFPYFSAGPADSTGQGVQGAEPLALMPFCNVRVLDGRRRRSLSAEGRPEDARHPRPSAVIATGLGELAIGLELPAAGGELLWVTAGCRSWCRRRGGGDQRRAAPDSTA